MKRMMMSSLAVLVTLGIFAQNKTAQDLKSASGMNIAKDQNDTVPKTWKIGGLFNLNFNQSALSNWSAGGDKSSVSLETFLNAHAFYKEGKNAWDNTLDMAYGMVSTTSLGT